MNQLTFNSWWKNTVWAHILCALWIPGLSFDDDTLRNEIDVSKHQNTEPATCMLCLEEGSIVYIVYKCLMILFSSDTLYKDIIRMYCEL